MLTVFECGEKQVFHCFVKKGIRYSHAPDDAG